MSDELDLDAIEHNLRVVHRNGILHAQCVIERVPDLIAEVRHLRAENADLRARLRPYLDLEAWQSINGERR